MQARFCQAGRNAGWGQIALICFLALAPMGVPTDDLHAAGVDWVSASDSANLGREVSIPTRLLDGEEFTVPTKKLLSIGERLFVANWTSQEGAGRPLTKGTGTPLTDPADPLVFPHNFNRISGPDANSCGGCHSAPLAGGNGDFVANVFVLGQRFDFAMFDGNLMPTKTSADELGNLTTLLGMANSRATPGMFGAGYIEMVSRQMTADLRSLRDTLSPGQSVALVSKGVNFGTLSRAVDGSWNTTLVEGLAAPSLSTTGPSGPPSLIVRPFHQAGNVISIRQFSNNAFNHHHGIQTSERFGVDADADGDGWSNEMTRAEVTAVSVFQAVMAVPGRVIPRVEAVERAVFRGEQLFPQIGCASCHVPSLPLDNGGWIYSEPNPYNPPGNLRPGETPTYSVNLNAGNLPKPRLKERDGVVNVPAYTDLKLHDITSGPLDPNREKLDMQQPAGSPGFFAGNSRFLTRKLWGVGRKPNYFHHGLYTTMREAIAAHAGEAAGSRSAFDALSSADRDAVIEFLKSLQVLPPGTDALIVDEDGDPRDWPPKVAGIGK